MSTSATITTTERTLHWTKERLPVVKQKRIPMQAARSYPCKDSAACTIVTTSLLEVRYGSFSNRLNAPRESVSAAKPQCARWALAGAQPIPNHSQFFFRPACLADLPLSERLYASQLVSG